MTFRNYSTLFLALITTGSVFSQQETPGEEELTEANYAVWRDHVLPRSWELNFQRIAWRTSFWEGVIEAQKKDMPILLWTMNGHPLCNT